MQTRLLSRIGRAAMPLAALVVLQACGSTATSVTSPTSLTRCGISMQPLDGPLPAEGGSAVINVTAARECAWSASVEGTWLSLKTGATGQGDGSVELAANANPDPVVRRGAVVANGQRTEISQAAGECTLSLDRSSASFAQSGGSGTVPVRASSGMCGWSASADAEWVKLRNTAGQGTGVVNFDIPASTGPPRSATITVAGQKFSVVQSEGCAYTITPASQSVGSSGGAGTIAIATTQGCPWTAASNVDWIKLTPASGAGAGTVAATVAATSGKARTGTAVVAGQPYTVTQGQGCTYNVQPANPSIGASGGDVAVSVSTNPECDWTASSNDSWITIQGRSSGAGNASITLAVAATSGPSRTGSATVAGQRVSVTQGQGCAYTISPESTSTGATASTGKVAVTTAAGCGWNATSNASWLTITSGSSGNGNGEVQYSATASSGPGRSGTLTVAGRTFTLTQGDGCSFSLSANSANVEDEGGQGTFNVQAGSGCEWTATSGVPWITITSGANGTGNGTVRFTVAANGGPSRSGVITAGGRTFTVQQGNGCSYSLSATNTTVPATGGNGSVNVTAGSGCSWNATSTANWITVSSGASGTGNGSVAFSVAANGGPPRSGTLSIANHTFTVNQTSGCSFSINPTSQAAPPTGGSVMVSVTSDASCAWTATSNVPWLTIAAGGSGTGSGTVQVDVQANSGASRSGTATIAGQTLTITQDTGCSYTVAPENLNAAAGGANSHIDIVAPASCGWNASSAAAWITIVSAASGTGNGGIDISVAGNTGPGRTGTLVVAGRTVTVTQDSGCTISLGATSETVSAAGGTGSIGVTAGAGCPWTAVSNAPWVTITGGSPGSGNGTVQYSVQPNATGAPRSATITIGNAVFSVNQQ